MKNRKTGNMYDIITELYLKHSFQLRNICSRFRAFVNQYIFENSIIGQTAGHRRVGDFKFCHDETGGDCLLSFVLAGKVFVEGQIKLLDPFPGEQEDFCFTIDRAGRTFKDSGCDKSECVKQIEEMEKEYFDVGKVIDQWKIAANKCSQNVTTVRSLLELLTDTLDSEFRDAIEIFQKEARWKRMCKTTDTDNLYKSNFIRKKRQSTPCRI